MGMGGRWGGKGEDRGFDVVNVVIEMMLRLDACVKEVILSFMFRGSSDYRGDRASVLLLFFFLFFFFSNQTHF